MESEKEFNTAKIKNFTDAFAFLMANRHKQNEVIKEMAEQERKTNSTEYADLGLSICNSELNNVSKQEDPLNLDKLINKSQSCDWPTKRCAIANLHNGSSNSPIGKNIEHGQKEEKKSVKFSSPDFNAFQWLMSNRSRSKESNNGDLLKDCDNESDNSEIDVYTGIINNQQRSKISSDNKVINSETCVSLSPTISFGQDNSPNSLRLTLINDTEEIDIEETFKEEISECGLKKSKSFRKLTNNKLRRKKNNVKNKQKSANMNETEEANSTTSHNDMHNIISCNENNVEKLEQSPGIAKFFLSSKATTKEGSPPDKLESKNVNCADSSKKEGSPPDKLGSKNVNAADSKKSSCMTNNAKIIPQNNKTLKLKWFKERNTKVSDGNDISILDTKNVLIGPSQELPSIEMVNSMESSTLEITNTNYTIFSKSKQSTKDCTESEFNKENEMHKMKGVESEIKILETINSERIEKKEKCMTKKAKNYKTVRIKKDNELDDPLNIQKNKSKKHCNILRSVRKEDNALISSTLPNGISAKSPLKNPPTEFIEISSPPKNKLFKSDPNKKEGSPAEKLESKTVNSADSKKSSCKTNNTKVIPQNNKTLKLKWFKERNTKVPDGTDISILETKKNVLIGPSKELPTIEKVNSMESSTLEITNTNYTIFSKSKQSTKDCTESENKKKNEMHKMKGVESEIKILETINSERIETKEKCTTKKAKNYKTVRIKKDNELDDNIQKNKSKKHCNILRSVRKEDNALISSTLPNGISAKSPLKKPPTEFIEISSPPKNKLFKIFNKMELSATKDIHLCNEDIQVPDFDNAITVIDDDASAQSVKDESKTDGNNGLRRSSRSIKKPVILIDDSLCEESKSSIWKINKSRSSNCSNTPERPPKYIKQKKLSKSFVLSTLEDSDNECWDIFKKSPGTKKLSSHKKKKSKGSNDKNKHAAQGSEDTPSDDENDDSIEIIALDDKALSNSGKRKMANNPVKAFAPIFKLKMQPSKDDLEKQKARDNFLFSESPLAYSLRQTIVESDDEDSYAPLPSYSHIQQKDEDNFWNLQHPQNGYFTDSILNSSTGWLPSKEDFEWENVVSPADASPESVIQEVPLLSSTSMFHIISHLNNESPSLKLFQFFKELLKMKKESLDLYYKDAPKNPPLVELATSNVNLQELATQNDTKRKRKLKSLSRSKRRKLSKGEKDVHEEIPLWHRWNPFSWNQVFSPSRVEFFIGEVSNVKEIEKWFFFWKEKTEKLCTRNGNPWKASSGTNSDDSDTNDSDSSYSNTMLLIGPPGVGKSALVYSLAQQFGFKVLEINASSQRQGKQVMSQLLEATQSHTVSAKSTNGNIDLKSSLNQKPSESQNMVENSKAKALVLIEDIDIVFEDSDEGFISAINTLMATTKRPIVLTLEHDSTNTTARLKEKYEKSILNPPMSSKIARYLQVMCLVDGLFVSYDEIKLLVEINGNDIRKSIQDIQFWLISGPTNVMTATIKFNADNDKGISDTLFANEELQATFDVPMAYDCLWVQSTFRGAVYENILSCFDWKLISPNISFLFNFPSTLKKEKSLMYPLHKDDRCVQIAKQQHQLKNDLFEFDTPPKKKTLNVISPKVDERTACANGAKISKENSALVGKCLTQMHRLHCTLSDLDILESGFGKIRETNYVTKRRSRFAYLYSGLESPHSAFSPTYSSLLNHTDMLQVISKNILLSTTDAVQEHINTLVDAKESFIERETSTLVLHPHIFMESNLEPHIKIQEKLENFCTLYSMTNRQSLYLDYFSYIRDIARSDQLSEVLHKLKKQRRYLPQMKQLGLFFSYQELNVMCNIFKNS